jgi:peptidylprolyl isomerase
MSVSKPEVDFPGGEPPTELEITDIWEGDGPVANPGDVVKVHYLGSRSLRAENSTRAGTGATPCSSSSALGGSSPAGTRAFRE